MGRKYVGRALGLVVVACALLGVTGVTSAAYQFTAVPEAAAFNGVNPSGTAFVGQSQWNGVTAEALLWNAGTITTYSGGPNGYSGADGYSAFTGINDSGQIVGFYRHTKGWYQFYSFHSAAYPDMLPNISSGASDIISYGASAIPDGINNAGIIVGVYNTPYYTGFLRHADDTYESLYYGSPSDYTNASGINTAGVVVGFATEGGPYHGWVRGTDGVFTSINVPLAVETYALGVNDLGQICGEWTDGAGHRHGFIRDVAGALVTVDFPGATDTGLCGISNTGIIVGYFGGADGSSQGFYATVPEPATLTLLWVGGLLTLRRRQRA